MNSPRVISGISDVTPKVWFPIYNAGSKNQELHNSRSPSITKNNSKIGPDFNLDCLFTCK